jgi:phospholipase/lecithinase/hemolysin
MAIATIMNRRIGKHLIASLAAASLVLAGCSSETVTKGTPRVVVFGESLVDVGTFGFKFTTQGSAPTGAASNKVFPEVIAASLGATQPCAYFRSTTGGASYTNTAGCTGFGVGGGKLISLDATSPTSLTVQLDAAASSIGSYTNDDVVVMSISGNDGADLIVSYIALAQGNPASFVALTSKVLGASTVTGLLSADPTTGAATVGIAYMTALATRTYDLVKSKVLDKGANKVVLANSPKLSVTPRLAIVLAGLQAQLGAPARAQLEGLFNTWVQSYNQQLAVKFSPEPRVAIFDLYALTDTFATAPATYSFTNSKDASCPPVGADATGPIYNLATCTEAAANGYIASGQTGLISGTKLTGNITGFVYSDNFHPTPRGHEIAGQVALNLMNAKGWVAR